MIYGKSENTVTRRIADETILVPLKGKCAEMRRIFALNPVAAHIWQEIDGCRSTEELRRSIASSFDVDENKATEDLQEFLGQLLENDLITRVDRT